MCCAGPAGHEGCDLPLRTGSWLALAGQPLGKAQRTPQLLQPDLPHGARAVQGLSDDALRLRSWGTCAALEGSHRWG